MGTGRGKKPEQNGNRNSKTPGMGGGGSKRREEAATTDKQATAQRQQRPERKEGERTGGRVAIPGAGNAPSEGKHPATGPQSGQNRQDCGTGGGDGAGGGRGGGGGGGDGHTTSSGENRHQKESSGGPGGPAAGQEAVKIYYCNAQSLVKKIDQLNCVAAELEPDIILITETWCHENISDAFLKIDGYEIVSDLRINRADTAHGRGGGLIVFIRPSFTVFKIDTLIDFSQYCVFKLDNVTIYLVYRSPNAPPNAIDGIVSLVRGAPQNSIIIGV